MLKDFLKTKTSKENLKIALDVIREYKSNESIEEWGGYFFSTWVHLEQLEEYIESLTKEFKPINYYDKLINDINNQIKFSMKCDKTGKFLLHNEYRARIRDRYIDIAYFLHDNKLLSYAELQYITDSLWLFYDYKKPFYNADNIRIN